MRTAPHWSSVLRAKVLHLLQGAVCGHLDLHAHVCGQKGEQETWITVKAPRAPARKLKQPDTLCALCSLLPLEREEIRRALPLEIPFPGTARARFPPGSTQGAKSKRSTLAVI